MSIETGQILFSLSNNHDNDLCTLSEYTGQIHVRKIHSYGRKINWIYETNKKMFGLFSLIVFKLLNFWKIDRLYNKMTCVYYFLIFIDLMKFVWADMEIQKNCLT